MAGFKPPVGGDVAKSVKLGVWTLKQLYIELNKLKKAECAAADRAVVTLRAHDVAIPTEWNRMSCDQKTAFLAVVVGTVPIGPVMAAIVLGSYALGDATVRAFNRNVKGAVRAAKKLGAQISNAAENLDPRKWRM